MPEAKDTYGTAFKNGSVTLMARVVGNNGANIVPVDITEVVYSIFLLDDRNPDGRTAVVGHSAVPLPIHEVVMSTLVVDPRWTVDQTGYNFCHTPDVSFHPAFAVAGRRYLIEYCLTAAIGQAILIRFRINVV